MKFSQWLENKVKAVREATGVVWPPNKKNRNVGPDAQAEGAPESMNKKWPNGVERTRGKA